MTIKRPKGVECLDCGSTWQTTSSSPKGFDDFKWRNLLCNVCGEHTWWGKPIMLNAEHMLMKATPVVNGERRTKNIGLALPIPTSLRDLEMQKRRLKVARFLQVNNITNQSQLEPWHRDAIKLMLEKGDDNDTGTG